MNEEEKKAIEELEFWLKYNYATYEGQKNIKTFSMMKEKIKKQQKEIETYKNEIKLQGYVTVDYIHKDKIREKIKEIREWDKEIGQENSWLSPYQIKVLEELLEEK